MTLREPSFLYRAHGRLTIRMFDGRPFTWRHRAALGVVRWCLNRIEMTRRFGWPW